MATYFREARNVELSLLYYLETNLTADWSGTSVVKTFKQVYAKDTALPIVCARLSDTTNSRLEVGANTLDRRFLVIIDIFAKSDAMRLDIADYIVDKLKDGWTYYLHSHVSGDNTQLDRADDGRCTVEQFVSDSRIDTGENFDVKDQYRHNVSVRIKVS